MCILFVKVFLQGHVVAASTDPALLEKHDGLTPMQRLEAESKGGSRAGSARVGSAKIRVSSAGSDR